MSGAAPVPVHECFSCLLSCPVSFLSLSRPVICFSCLLSLSREALSPVSCPSLLSPVRCCLSRVRQWSCCRGAGDWALSPTCPSSSSGGHLIHGTSHRERADVCPPVPSLRPSVSSRLQRAADRTMPDPPRS
ncbi:hypothetical protein WMY93_001195 [Mugilogobius chulae]|uniref:Uncharacterized protein n=1 Tax=Mugilogobius chulae TaxID=88201 RepID=A0AAW0Q4N6_9GOBI